MATALPAGSVTPPVSRPSFSGWALATLGTVRQLDPTRTDPSEIRARLLEAGQELTAIRRATHGAGFRLLGLEDRAFLESLADPTVQAIPLADLSTRLQRVTAGSGFLEAFAVTQAPPGLVPKKKSPPSRFIPGFRVSPTLANGGTVMSQTFELVMEAAREATGIQPPEDPHESEPGCFRNVHTVHAAIPRPEGREAKKKLMDEAKWDDAKLEAYYDAQMGRMPPETSSLYLETAEKIASLHDLYEESNQEVLKAIEVAGGRPSPKAWSEAKDNLERVIYEGSYLSSRGIDPLRFSILEARHDEEVYRASPNHDPELAASLKRKALALEANYVVDTLAGMATVARDLEKNEKEFHRLDLLAAHAKRVYLRLTTNYQVLTTDADDLSFFRGHLFPFDQPERQIDWRSPAMGPVLEACRQYQAAEADYGRVMKHFRKTIAPATWRHAKKRTELTLGREELDYQFQRKRFGAEFKRIREFVEAKGGAVAEDHITYFEQCMELLEKRHKENIEYWKGLASGEDATARPATRNSKNKAEMTLMAYVINLFIEDLYKIHGHPTRPSWISFADNNVFTALDEAMGRGIHPDDVRSWLVDFVDKFGIVKDELGMSVWGKKLTGREAPDRYYVHSIATTAGSGFRKGTDGRTIIYGLQNQASISLPQTPHPDLELSDPDHKVYPDRFFGRLQHYLLPILTAANHTGIEEFRIFAYLAALGLPAPQLMQAGAADMPLAGDYGAAMSGILDRSKGADAVVELLYEALLHTKESMFYFTGTRDSSGTGFHHYRRPRKKEGTGGKVRYSNLHAPRILTDDYATGRLETLIATLWERRFKGHGRPVVLQPVIHNGNKEIPETVWNLAPATSLEARITQILDNASPATGLNAARDVPRQIGFMPPIPSTSFLTEKDMREVLQAAGETLQYEDGSDLSQGDLDFLTQRVNVATTLWLQEEEASGMDLAMIPDQNEWQKRREAELRALSHEQQMRESWYPLYRHMLDRLSDTPPLPPYDTRKRPETKSISDAERRRLARVIPRRAARALLRGFPDQEGKREEEAWEVLEEMAQRGGSLGRHDQEHGTITALDGDGLLWDHTYEIKEDLPDIIYREAVDGLAGRVGADAEARLLSNATVLTEHINLRPEAVAFLIGYRARTGRSPVLYSSTMESRIHEMAKKATENPMAREFFKALLGIDFYGWREGDIKKAIDQAIADGKIITRTQIANYVTDLLTRYREAGFNPTATDQSGKRLFTDEERHDLLLILRNGGDVHCKYRGLLPYRVLFDDRTVNAWHAISANRRGDPNDKGEGARSVDLRPFGIPATDVRVYQPERHSDNPLEVFVAVRSKGPKPTSHIEARLNKGRDGSVREAIRAAEEDIHRPVQEVPPWTLIPQRRRPAKTPGLRDQSFTIPVERKAARDLYLEPARKAEELAKATLADLEALASEEESRMAEDARELAGLLEKLRRTAVASIPKPRLKNAIDRLEPKKGGFKPITKKTEQTMLERAIWFLGECDKRRAGELLKTLLEKRLCSDQVRAIRQQSDYPKMERSGVIDQVKMTLQWLGGVAQHEAIGAVGQELPQTRRGQMALKAASWTLRHIGLRGARETELLLDLGRSMDKNEHYDMEPERVVEAYGVVARLLGPDLLRWVLSKLATDDRVPAATRMQIVRQRGILEGKIREVGQLLQTRVKRAREVVTEGSIASAAVIGVGHFIGGIQELRDPLREIWQQGAGTAAKSLVVGVINSVLDDVRKGREARTNEAERAQMEGMEDHWEVGQKLVDHLLKELIILSDIFSEGGRNPVGDFLQETRIHLDETGFEPFMQHLALLVDGFDWPTHESFVVRLIYLLFPSERQADEILASLRKNNRDKAQGLLVAQARLMLVAEEADAALNRFSRLAEALWRHAEPGDQETVRGMIQQAHQTVFKT